ncbi:TPA: hypothetical protein N0F65_002662 [Lagenidium giganteum]|uniref:Uncharacterized protein n=1 Tax=Lagenidium giganteum TaxID=4803 RepID=A0AAV2Z5P1_9STRA|nr:TPA: hypothetical protein N0F65_002662 [Lagenidium giganteum]
MAEWAAAHLTSGSRLNVLQQAYQHELGLAALPMDASVTVVRFKRDAAATAKVFDEVPAQHQASITLHEQQDSAAVASPAFRVVAWSRANSTHTSAFLSIACQQHLEMWSIALTAEGVEAQLVLQVTDGPMWTNRQARLFTVSDHQLAFSEPFENVTSPLLVIRDDVWKSSKRTVHLLEWDSIATVMSTARSCHHVDLQSASTRQLLDVPAMSLGSIVAVAVLSPLVCVVTTDTPLVLDRTLGTSVPTPSSDLPGRMLPSSSTTSILSSSNSNDENIVIAPKTDANELLDWDGSTGVIDLTSLRTSRSTATRNPLQIVPTIDSQDYDANSRRGPESQLLLLVRDSQATIGPPSWRIQKQVALPGMSCPDLLVTSDLRAVVGSSLSRTVFCFHFDENELVWDATVSGQLDLPTGHACRGVFLAARSPFLQAVSAEKRKATFFLGATTRDAQRLHLLKFKLPRRRVPARANNSKTAAQASYASINSIEPTAVTDRTDPVSNANFAAVLTKLDALEKMLSKRFDGIDSMLHRLSSRIERLENHSN